MREKDDDENNIRNNNTVQCTEIFSQGETKSIKHMQHISVTLLIMVMKFTTTCPSVCVCVCERDAYKIFFFSES
jgi:hypothetical protein